jgi:hypothetical protein
VFVVRLNFNTAGRDYEKRANSVLHWLSTIFMNHSFAMRDISYIAEWRLLIPGIPAADGMGRGDTEFGSCSRRYAKYRIKLNGVGRGALIIRLLILWHETRNSPKQNNKIMSNNNLMQLFNEKNKMILDGKIVDASEKFFADNTRTYDFTGATTVGKKQHTAAMESFVGSIAKVNEISLLSSAVGDGMTFGEFTFRFDMKDGSKINWHEIIMSKWENGLIVEERYFQA